MDSMIPDYLPYMKEMNNCTRADDNAVLATKDKYRLTFVWWRIILFAIEYFQFSVPCKFNAKGQLCRGKRESGASPESIRSL